ncbi:hypothetical protein D1Y84_09350 [Acidipila sp. EB88]|nr:hypothetical protein D1Y84_09350 [Acidipila sp. EB88]
MLWSLLVSAEMLAMPSSDLLVRTYVQGADVREQSVAAMLQTRDGYLWVGTGKGLMRFDGVAFTSFTAENTPGIAGDDISFDTLWEDREGVLWAGTYTHGVIRNDHGHFSTLERSAGLPDLNILRIDGDETGAVWIFTTKGVSRWQHGRLEQVHPEQDGSGAEPPVPHDDRRGIDFEKMGLWRHTSRGMERFAFGHWNLFPTPMGEDHLFEQNVRSIYEDHQRRVWYSVFRQRGRYFCAQGSRLNTYEGLPENAFVSYQDRAGYLWLNDHGAHPARWREGKLYPLPGMHTSNLLNVLERPDGMIWAGGLDGVLFQFRPRFIQTIATAGVPEVGSVLFEQRSGVVWAGGTNLLRLKARKTEARFQTLVPGRTPWNYIFALSEDTNGHLLVSSRRQGEIEEIGDGKITTFLPPSPERGVPQAMLLASSGAQWIGTSTGLFRYRHAVGAQPERLWSGNVRCLAEAGPHAIWAGTAEGPLRFEDGQERPMPAAPAWHFGEVQSISIDHRGELWMATRAHGIVGSLEGRFRAFGTADGLPTNTIYSINFGDDDDLWLRSDVGLIRVRRPSVEHRSADPARKLQLILLDGNDGLPWADMQPAGNQGFLHLDGGVFWFATPGGIAALHPSDLRYQASSPRAIMEEHAIDQSGLLPESSFALAPGQKDLELHYTALGSARPGQVNFRYRMRGFDQDWIVAGTRRVAYYTQLPPGAYTFEVQAADGDSDAWQAASAMAYVRVLTPFYRSWWMKVLLGGGLVGGLLLSIETRRRMDRDRSRMRQAFTHRLIAAQEGERKRIAHELHDSLGQHLVLIRTLATLPASLNGARADHLAKIADQAAVAIHEVETISYDLRPYQLDRLGLTRTVLSLVEAFAADTPMRVTHSIENIDGFFPKDLEIHVYRIVQEALGNILKHAEASEVAVTVAQSEFVLRLVVADNGRGFLSSAAGGPERGGLGLIGIEERAEALGGSAVIESAEGNGTKVLVTAPRTYRSQENNAS